MASLTLIQRLLIAFLTATLLPYYLTCNAFVPPSLSQLQRPSLLISFRVTSKIPTHLHVTNQSPDAPKTAEEDAALQWDLFTRHHAVDGEWWGSWNTYDYMGDVVDSTVAGLVFVLIMISFVIKLFYFSSVHPAKTCSVSLQPSGDYSSVAHSHRILSTSTQSDCNTCFSSSQFTTFPIATYDKSNLGRRHRCAAVGMVVGPSLLPKSGLMSTELSLRHGDGRVRVTFQHAPVWERGVEPGSCPPQGLKLFRAIVSKEKLRPRSTDNEIGDGATEGKIQGPPTAEEEQSSPPTPGNPRFFRPVPPFKWHAKWSGTSWTWGPQTGDRGWAIDEIEEADAWHGRPMGDTSGVWSLRLPGGLLIQCPRVVIAGVSGLCRLAWMPEDDGEVGTSTDGNRAKLLRLEASVMALEPIISDDDEDMMVGFYPPSLGSLRCDILEKVGELDGASLDEREKRAEGFVWDEVTGSINNVDTAETVKPTAEGTVVQTTSSIDENLAQKIREDPRNALDL
ncbi:hypothetical protein ACHAWX_005788 [Stephanocyclus meneghinianus]